VTVLELLSLGTSVRIPPASAQPRHAALASVLKYLEVSAVTASTPATQALRVRQILTNVPPVPAHVSTMVFVSTQSDLCNVTVLALDIQATLVTLM